MVQTIEKYWEYRLEQCEKALLANNFGAYIAGNSAEAKQIVFEEIIPKSEARTFSYAGSLTVDKLNIIKQSKKARNIRL